MQSVDVILFGVGQTGLAAAQQLIDMKFDITAVYTLNSSVNEDVGTLAGREPLGVRVKLLEEFSPTQAKADVALFCTTGSPYDLLETPKQCLEAGINVITLAEGATYPWTYDEALSKELDDAGKRGGVSLASTGMTDTYMVHLPVVLASTVPNVRRVEVTIIGDFGRLGPCALNEMPLGLAPADFAAMMESPPPKDAKPPPSISGQCLEAMVSLMGLGPGEINTVLDIILAKQDIEVKTTGKTISAGTISGLIENVEMMTKEGIELSINFSAEIFDDDKPEEQCVTIQSRNGEKLVVEASPIPGVEFTVAIAINRIFDIIAASPGLQTIDRLPAPLFRLSNNNEKD